MLVKQHARYCCRACSSTKVHQHDPNSSKLPHHVLHKRHAFLLRPSHRPYPSFWGVIIPVHHLLSRHSSNSAHHVSPPRIAKRSLGSHAAVHLVSKALPGQTFFSETAGRFRQRSVKKVSTTGITDLNDGALRRKEPGLLLQGHAEAAPSCFWSQVPNALPSPSAEEGSPRANGKSCFNGKALDLNEVVMCCRSYHAAYAPRSVLNAVENTKKCRIYWVNLAIRRVYSCITNNSRKRVSDSESKSFAAKCFSITAVGCLFFVFLHVLQNCTAQRLNYFHFPLGLPEQQS